MPIDEADREKLKSVAIRASIFSGLVIGLPVTLFLGINGLQLDGFASLIAAQGGNAEAQFRVGGAYLYGWNNVARDREKARYWIKAAAQGHKMAQRNLPDVDTVPF